MAAQIKNYSAESTGLITPLGQPVLIAEAPKFEDMNPHLVGVIRRIQADGQNAAAGREIGGVYSTAWHSKPVLAKMDDAVVQELLSWFQQEAHKLTLQLQPDWLWLNPDDWEIEAWSNVYPSGSVLGSHHHADKQHGVIYGPIWAGVYYVDTDDSADAGGETVLEGKSLVPATIKYQPDPFDQEFPIQPKAGHLVIFPSWLDHHVREYRGKRDRIIIGMNFFHPGIAVHHAGIIVHRVWPLVIRPRATDWMHRKLPGVMSMLRHGTLWYRQRFGGSSAT